ncbi:hypothetical protein [Acetobacter sp. P1H12_c]|uniref:hypothetical protein n=1 Tax=Acetobacter sp. P1H12_c TaxID=2762621 RepID=UPI001C04191F|nr:hypothetical protein [Acetobacter sp. P1H12_c]
MALKQKTVTVPHEGADKGKMFIITRMSAYEADKWGRHAVQAAIKGGGAIPGLTEGGGLAEVAAAGIGIFGSMEPATMDTLIDQLLECVAYVPDLANPAVTIPFKLAANTNQIEEIPTVGWLQKEAFSMHVDFFKGVGQLFSLLSLLLQMGNSAPSPDAETSVSASPS